MTLLGFRKKQPDRDIFLGREMYFVRAYFGSYWQQKKSNYTDDSYITRHDKVR